MYVRQYAKSLWNASGCLLGKSIKNKALNNIEAMCTIVLVDSDLDE